MGRTLPENHRFSAKFNRFGLYKGIFKKFLFRCSFFFFAPKFSFAKIGATFRLEMGQQIGLRKRFILFWPNSIVSASEMAFFSKFSFRWSFFFFTPEFSLRQISATFRLEIGQWEGLPWRIIVFQRNSIVSVHEMAFFKTFRFGAHFFCVPKFCFT